MMTLASAFRLRNKLKAKIKELTNQAMIVPYEIEYGNEENTAPLDGFTISQIINQTINLMKMLNNFNQKIEEANKVNKQDLITLESIKSEISHFKMIVTKCRRMTGFIEYINDGHIIKNKATPLVDQMSMVEHLEKLEKEKDVLEEKLSISNFKTPVQFDEQEILKVL